MLKPRWIERSVAALVRTLIALSLAFSACVPVPAYVRRLPELNGLVYATDGLPEEGVIWQTEQTGEGACDILSESVAAITEGKFDLPASYAFGIYPVSILEFADTGQTWTLCLQRKGRAVVRWEARTFGGGPGAPRQVELLCHSGTATLSCTFESLRASQSSPRGNAERRPEHSARVSVETSRASRYP
jgi:hypothetical protein